MGAAESRQLTNNDSAPRSGYHVVRVAANSPAHLAGIEPFFDFCVGLDGVALTTGEGDKQASLGGSGPDDGLDVWKKLEEREETEVTLNIWSSKRQELRDVRLIPSRRWSTSSSSDPSSQPSLLGLTLRPCSPHLALASVWHILDILENSPAESAGLVPFGDYVIGWSGGVLRHEGDFYELVESHEGRPLRLYVYNSDYDHTREVIIVPNREWGGEGLLGCGVGFGLLHRIPRPQDRPPMDDERGGSRGGTARGGILHNGNNVSQEDDYSQRSFTPDSGPSNGLPKSSTDPNLAKRSADPRRPPGPLPDGDQDDEDDEDEDDDDEDGHAHRSGVTISMRRDEDEEEDGL